MVKRRKIKKSSINYGLWIAIVLVLAAAITLIVLSIEPKEAEEPVNYEEQLFYACFYGYNLDWSVIDMQENLDVYVMTTSPDDNLEVLMDQITQCSQTYIDENKLTVGEIRIQMDFNGTGVNNHTSVKQTVSLK